MTFSAEPNCGRVNMSNRSVTAPPPGHEIQVRPDHAGSGRSMIQARDEAVAADVVINGLPILAWQPQLGGATLPNASWPVLRIGHIPGLNRAGLDPNNRSRYLVFRPIFYLSGSAGVSAALLSSGLGPSFPCRSGGRSLTRGWR